MNSTREEAQREPQYHVTNTDFFKFGSKMSSLLLQVLGHRQNKTLQAIHSSKHLFYFYILRRIAADGMD